MRFDPFRHHRRSIRLKGFDYTQPGAYFLTICIEKRECLLGDVQNGVMTLNEYGEIVRSWWLGLPDYYPHVQLDAYVIMPNHLHGILILLDNAFVTRPMDKRHSIPDIVRGFKVYSAIEINKARNSKGASVWQRNYYEHLIRPGDEEITIIRQYVENNPLMWDADQDNPSLI